MAPPKQCPTSGKLWQCHGTRPARDAVYSAPYASKGPALEQDVYRRRWDPPPPPTSPPPPYPGPETSWSRGQDDGMSPPPYTVHPPPFHAATQPEGLERLERWVGTCHREIQWQPRHNTVAPSEVTQPQRGWQTPAGIPSRRPGAARPPPVRDGDVVSSYRQNKGVRSQRAPDQVERWLHPVTADIQSHGAQTTPS